MDDSDKEEEDGEGEIELEISVHALDGNSGYRTMRVTEFVGRKPFHILIDSGSTHNFLDEELGRKLGCPLVAIYPKRVIATNEGQLICQFISKDFNW